MTTTIQRVSAALKAANDELYAIIKYNVRDGSWEIWIDNKPAEVNFKDFDKAEDRCEELNYEYAARKAIEVINTSPVEFKIVEYKSEPYDWRKDPMLNPGNGY